MEQPFGLLRRSRECGGKRGAGAILPEVDRAYERHNGREHEQMMMRAEIS